MTTTIDQLWAAVAAVPTDDTAKLALADALREADSGPTDGRLRHADVAHVVRLLVAERRWPKKGFSSQWSWTSGTTAAVPRKQTHVLPTPWYGELKRTRTWVTAVGDVTEAYCHYGRSCRGQVERLTTTLVRLRDQMKAVWPL